MRRTAEQQVKTRIFYVIVASLALGGVLLGLAVGGRGVTAEQLQAKLIEACTTTRQPLQTYFNQRLAESKRRSIRELQEAFPGFPPEEIRRSILRERLNLKTLLATYDPARCAKQYS